MPPALTRHVVTPVTGVSLPHAPALASALGPGVSVTCSRIKHGPASIECALDEAKAAGYGLADCLASVRSVGIPVLGLGDDTGRLIAGLTEQGLRAVHDDGAHVLILGCTGTLGLAADLATALAEQGVPGVPVVDPLSTTLQVAAVLARSGLSHSKRTYPHPPAKHRPGYETVLSPSPAPDG
jgi:allantoin racemase